MRVGLARASFWCSRQKKLLFIRARHDLASSSLGRHQSPLGAKNRAACFQPRSNWTCISEYHMIVQECARHLINVITDFHRVKPERIYLIHRIIVAIAVEIIIAGAKLFRVGLEEAACEHHLSRPV